MSSGQENITIPKSAAWCTPLTTVIPRTKQFMLQPEPCTNALTIMTITQFQHINPMSLGWKIIIKLNSLLTEHTLEYKGTKWYHFQR